MLEFHSNKGTDFLPEEAMKKYHTSLFNPIHKGKIDTWKSNLTENEIKVADWVAGQSAELVGYSKGDSKIGWTGKIKAFPYLIYGRLWNVVRTVLNKMPFGLHMIFQKLGLMLPRLLYKIKK